MAIVQLDAEQRVGPLKIVSDKATITSVARGMCVAEKGPVRGVELRVKGGVVDQQGHHILGGVGEVHVRGAFRDLAADIDALPVDAAFAQPFSEAAAEYRKI